MDKEDVVHIENGTLLSHLKKKKKERNNAICSNTGIARNFHTK